MDISFASHVRVNIEVTLDQQIEALKRLVDAETDMALAERMGLQRFAVSKWRGRGRVPDKYLLLIREYSASDIASAYDGALRLNIFGRHEPAYWLRAALAVLPPLELREGETPEARGRRLERVILRIMGLAITVTNRVLRQEHCLTDEDCDRIIAALQADHADDIAQLARRD